MSGSRVSLVHCYKMSSSSDNYNDSRSLGNITLSSDQSASFVYTCEYLDLHQRVLQLVKEPHSAIAIVLGITGIVINILCLLAVHFQMHGRFTAHFRFIVSLGLSDILICVSVISHFVNKVLNPTVYPGEGPAGFRLRSRCAYIVIKALNTTALNISLLNLTGMALDHFVAILVPLKCNQLMSKSKSTSLIIIFWLISIICGYSDLFSIIPDRQHLAKYNFCELAFLTPYQEEFTVFFIAFLCFVCMVFIYIKIYIKIHERRRKSFNIHDDHRTHLSDNMKQTKKALVTTLIILGTFVTCWLPLCLFQIILIIQVKVNPAAIVYMIPYLDMADKYLFDLMLLNAIVDPNYLCY